jgi:hypothetical protein
MSIRFSPQVMAQGFDNFSTPKWQMVPMTGGVRVLEISGHGKLVPRVRAAADVLTAVQTASGSKTILTLTGGKNAGKAFVEWVPDLKFVGAVDTAFTLEVSVKALKTINTAFHYVDDGRKQKTKRQIADLDAMIAGANLILTPQANLKLARKSAAALPIAQNLGDVVRFSSHLTGPPDNVPIAQHEWDDLFAKVDATADFNVFFVKEFEIDATPYIDDSAEAGTVATDKMCIFEDRVIRPASEVLAHETVHLLGIGDHSSNNWHLIASGATRKGRWINRDQANTVNPSGT